MNLLLNPIVLCFFAGIGLLLLVRTGCQIFQLMRPTPPARAAATSTPEQAAAVAAFDKQPLGSQLNRTVSGRSLIIPASTEVLSKLTAEEEKHFFLHEIELEIQQELTFNSASEIEVTKKQHAKLVNYFHFTSKVTTPEKAFAHFGFSLQVVKRAKRQRTS